MRQRRQKLPQRARDDQHERGHLAEIEETGVACRRAADRRQYMRVEEKIHRDAGDQGRLDGDAMPCLMAFHTEDNVERKNIG